MYEKAFNTYKKAFSKTNKHDDKIILQKKMYEMENLIKKYLKKEK